jgi:prepilin-type N-terminal cleavage/methylation domain-containing protein
MRRGFTLVEFLVVLMIILMLLGLLLPAISIIRNPNTKTGTVSGLEQLRVLKEYEVSGGWGVPYVRVRIINVQGKRMALFTGSDSLAVMSLPEE